MLVDKSCFEKKTNARSFQVGDFVWRWYPLTAKQKLGLGWIGPYNVVRKVTDFVYSVQKSPDSELVTLHVDHLKPYAFPEVLPSWKLDQSDVFDQEDLDIVARVLFLPN